jgi:ABC-type multidrug transport system fused ATPase/permease subunit
VAAGLPVGPLGVEVDDVDFAYPGGPPVLTDLRFTVHPGEVLALTGATGSGKSTLCYLLARLMDPTDGRIEVGGVDLTVADPRELRSSVALVFQETFLFADSVQENLTLSEPIPDATVAWATGIARADEFIGALDRGRDTVIGERGVTLSGGQRQRLALARALLRHPRLLILDDATSAVDPRIEQQILSGLRRELDMTTVVVAHRVSTIALADRVLFLDEGRLVAEGSHEDLLATVPAYEALIRAYEAADAEDEDEELSA